MQSGAAEDIYLTWEGCSAGTPDEDWLAFLYRNPDDPDEVKVGAEASIQGWHMRPGFLVYDPLGILSNHGNAGDSYWPEVRRGGGRTRPGQESQRARLYITPADIACDANGDGQIDEADEPCDENPGLIIGLNDNDSDGDGEADNLNLEVDGDEDKAELAAITVGVAHLRDLVREGLGQEKKSGGGKGKGKGKGKGGRGDAEAPEPLAVGLSLTQINPYDPADHPDRGGVRIFTNDGQGIVHGHEVIYYENGEEDSRESLWALLSQGGQDPVEFLVEGVHQGPVELRLDFTVEDIAIASDTLRVTIPVLEFVIPGPGGAPVATDFVGVSDPRPTVHIEEKSVQLDGETVVVRLRGYVQDPIADNIPAGGGADIQGLRFLVNGQGVSTCEGQLSRLDEDEVGGKSFWRQHPYKAVFGYDRSAIGQTGMVELRFPASEGTHDIRVETAPNAAGNTGFASLAVTTVKQPIPQFTDPLEPGDGGGGGTPTDPRPIPQWANIFLPTDLTPGIDTIRYYSGTGPPEEDDPVLTETTGQGRSFQGTSKGRAVTVRLWPTATTTPTLNPAAVDRLEAIVSYEIDREEVVFPVATYVETDADSKQFRLEVGTAYRPLRFVNLYLPRQPANESDIEKVQYFFGERTNQPWDEAFDKVPGTASTYEGTLTESNGTVWTVKTMIHNGPPERSPNRRDAFNATVLYAFNGQNLPILSDALFTETEADSGVFRARLGTAEGGTGGGGDDDVEEPEVGVAWSVKTDSGPSSSNGHYTPVGMRVTGLLSTERYGIAWPDHYIGLEEADDGYAYLEGGSISFISIWKVRDKSGTVTYRYALYDHKAGKYLVVVALNPKDLARLISQGRLSNDMRTLEVDGKKLSVLAIDLDYTGDNKADDLNAYIPGYAEDNTPKVSSSKPQELGLILSGFITRDYTDLSVVFGFAKKHSAANPYWPIYTATMCSEFPGYCTNRPTKESVTTGRDFYFAKEKETSGEIAVEDGEAIAAFYCHDYAGKCVVTAKVKHKGATKVLVQLEIPVDADSDFVADAWERKVISTAVDAIENRTIQASSDEMATLVGRLNGAMDFDAPWQDVSICYRESDVVTKKEKLSLEFLLQNEDWVHAKKQTIERNGIDYLCYYGSQSPQDECVHYYHPGDGLTLWEEYRGFVAQGESDGGVSHHRTNPLLKRDLFVCLYDSSVSQYSLSKTALEFPGVEDWYVPTNYVTVTRNHRTVINTQTPKSGHVFAIGASPMHKQTLLIIMSYDSDPDVAPGVGEYIVGRSSFCKRGTTEYDPSLHEEGALTVVGNWNMGDASKSPLSLMRAYRVWFNPEEKMSTKAWNEAVLTHEVGHELGLAHYNAEGYLMHPRIHLNKIMGGLIDPENAKFGRTDFEVIQFHRFGVDHVGKICRWGYSIPTLAESLDSELASDGQ